MRKISVSECKPGMVVGKTIPFTGATILLEAGTKLKQSYINRLISLGISEIYINDDISDGIVIGDVVKEQTRLEAIELIRNIMDNCCSDDILFSERITEAVNKIIDDIFSSGDIVVNLIDIKSFDNYTYMHSVNVCILSIITGIKMKLSYEALKELGIGALLHDIGKITVPEGILKKKDSLDDKEYELIKQHALMGYKILKKVPKVSEASALVALCHHERYDGKGYIQGLSREDIHIYSRIVAIADIFDALTSDRVYRRKISTSQAIDYLTEIADVDIDPNILKYFTQAVPPFQIGTGVVLNNGERGIVTRLNKDMPTKPIVRIVFNSDGSRRLNYTEINLATDTTFFVTSTSEIV
jgi:HD-GYP domain-containing protein (c-di-GMP phosphodiesterase class II)